MRIGWVVTGGFDRSGRDRVVPALLWTVERLAARHDVVVFVLRHYQQPSTYSLRGATIVDVGRTDGLPWFRLARQFRKLSKAVEAHGPFDVLHGCWGVPGGVLAAAVGRWRHVPSVATFDSGELESLPDIDYGLQRSMRTRAPIRTAAKWADRLLVCTEYMAARARARGMAAHVLPFGIDTAMFSPPPVRPEGPPWRLLQVASLNLVKDQRMLLAALQRVVREEPDTHLDLVGEDTLGGLLPAVARGLGLDAHVTFHGFQRTDCLPAFYQRAHVYVQSSRHEAAGVSVLEASAAGVPTVGTRVGYVADWARDAAVAVPMQDPDALATAILAMLRDPDRRARVASEARRRAVAHDADWTAAALTQLYRTLA
ncbi:MAG TPA: glycosyltransferase family 4 protein [Vicinamibacterales bacterium]|nr:glycosyltransferase family 4 protein [Vicinamibacterales bacterium]